MPSAIRIFILTLVIIGIACGDDVDDVPSDASSMLDAGPTDTQAPDSGTADGGRDDLGPTDADPVDLGTDTGTSDLGATDMGPIDTGGSMDTGVTDMGTTDLGPMDAGLPSSLEIIGVWASNFGAQEVITSTAFNRAAIRQFDNGQNFLVSQNSTTAPFFPGRFNRIVWTEPVNDRFFYCTVDFDLPSLQAALASTRMADATNPEVSGCGGFPWTRLRRGISIRGDYLSNFGTLETITATIWSQSGPPMRLIDWDELQQWVVTRNDASAMFFPSLFNRIEFTTPSSTGSFFYCFTDFGVATATGAIGSSNRADRANPAASGCGMFPWTRLDPR